MRRRQIPAGHLCHIRATTKQDVSREIYNSEVAGPIGECLKKDSLIDSVFYIVTTLGVPLRIEGTGGPGGSQASVDSELAALYYDLTHGKPHPVDGPFFNPFFGNKSAHFSHPAFPLYLVTRLAAYDVDTANRLVDQCMRASNRGKFVIDAGAGGAEGNRWLRDAAIFLPKDRVVYDDTERILYSQSGVIGYASWGSNDPGRHDRFLNFQWLPGAIVTEYVSTDARTFQRPPDTWNLGDWNKEKTWYFGSPQSLSADYLQEGASGASGHVYEPYLRMTPRPDLLLPAYYQGRNLAESYYLAIPAISWQNVVIGDPLCSIGKP